MTKKWRIIGIINGHDFYGSELRIDWHPGQGGRAFRPKQWVVVKGNEKTDPGAHWQDWGRKAFSAFGDKELSLAKAQEWCDLKYGPREWKKGPFAAYASSEFIRARKRRLNKALKLYEIEFDEEGRKHYVRDLSLDGRVYGPADFPSCKREILKRVPA